MGYRNFFNNINKFNGLFLSLILLLISVTTSTCADKKEGKNKVDTKTSLENNVSNQKIEGENKDKLVNKEEKKVINVYLFHGTYRCYSCNRMEELTLEAINETFSKEKEKGLLTFEHINVEEPQHNHFINDYRIASISIIVSKKVDGKEKEWKNLDQVWMLLGDREKFKDYIVKEIKSYL